MKKLIFQSGVLLLLLALVSTGQAQDQFTPVFCDRGQSIQDAVDRAPEGAFINVFGTCEESVVIQTDRLKIGAFFGQATTVIPQGGNPAFLVHFADGVHIQNFNISGGGIGVFISNGSSAVILNNQISDITALGIGVAGGSFAFIANNVLHSNNGNFGQILVGDSSSASVVDNTITASSGVGISAASASSVSVGGNNVSGTAGSGITVAQNAHMSLFSENTVNTINCSFSGSLSVDTEQTITGGAGAVFLETHCDLFVPDGVTFP